jgi:excisionase family DNA binding protein
MSGDVTLVNDTGLARLLRVPASWLREEAEAGRLPHVRAGRAFLFHYPTVKQLLTARASREGTVVRVAE